MRRLIATLAGTNCYRPGHSPSDRVVTRLATLALRALCMARFLLGWLAGARPAELQAAAMCRVQSAGAGSARWLKHDGLSMRGWRAAERPVVSEASRRRF